jgi:excisionase family DNA binding protein
MPPGTVIPIVRETLLELINGQIVPQPVVAPRDLTVREVAVRLQVSPKTVTRWLVAGRLVGRKLPHRGWRVPESSLANTPSGVLVPRPPAIS